MDLAASCSPYLTQGAVKMKKVVLLAAVLAILPLVASAEEQPTAPTRKACEELKSEIAAKLDAKGVKSYTLTSVKSEEVKPEDKVVGSCDAGTMKIVYVRK
jgi:lipopolysaccharide export system protein LptC